MSNRPTDIETVVLSREYLETVHGRMTFNEVPGDDDGDDEEIRAAKERQKDADVRVS
jgi:hypothetical protein